MVQPSVGFASSPLRQRDFFFADVPKPARSESTNEAGYENRLNVTNRDRHNRAGKPARLYQNPSIFFILKPGG